MSAASDNAAELRLLVDKLVLRNSSSSVQELAFEVQKAANAQGVTFDRSIFVDYVWLLARQGVVAIFGRQGIASPGSPTIEPLMLTQRGRLLLERGETSPHDPTRYLDAVKRRVPAPDGIALAYLDEAVAAWAGGLNRSSAVMLGCACEQLVLLLAQAVVAAGLVPWSERIEKKLTGIARTSALFDHVRGALMALRAQKKLPGDLADALDRKLSPIFDHARGLRNTSGHPTDVDVSAGDAEAGLLLFPGFYQLVDGLTRFLQAQAATTP